MPTLKSPQDPSEKLWSDMILELEFEETDEIESPPKPEDWIQSISQPFITTDFNNMTKILGSITTVSTNTNKTLKFLEENPQLAVLSIASGWQGDIEILHHFKSFNLNDDEEKTTFAINGTSPAAQILQIIPSRLLKTESATVPTLENIIQQQNLPQASSDESTEKITMSNSIILPPKFTEALLKAKVTKAEMAYDIIANIVKIEDDNAKKRWKQVNNIEEDEDDPIEDDETTESNEKDNTTKIWENTFFQQALLILQHLIKWSECGKREQGFRISNHQEPIDWLLQQMWGSPNQNKTKNQDQNESTTITPNLDHVRFVGRPNIRNPFTTPNTNTRNFPTLDEQSITSNISSPNTTTNQYQANNTINFDAQNQNQTNLAASMFKMAGSIERFANSHAAQVKEKQKISSNIQKMLQNLGTLDGQNPAPELTEALKDLMRSSGENVPLSLDIMMQKKKAYASPTARFQRAIQKGIWTFETGSPDNCCIMNLPSTLAGTPLENIDISKVLGSEDEKGRTLNDQEQSALFSSVTVPSRTFNFLMNKAKAWKTITSDCFTEDSAFAVEAEEWFIWLDENLELLQRKAAAEDKDLPCRIECIMSELNNQYAQAAKYGVPSDKIIRADHIRDGIIQGIYKPNIPRKIMDILHPPNKKRHLDNDRRGGGGGGGGGGNGGKHGNNDAPPPKKRWNPVEYKGQPREFKFTSDKYKNVIYLQMTQDKIKPPWYAPGKCQECLRYLLLGNCNDKCNREKAHVNPNNDEKRKEEIRAFIKTATDTYKSTKKPGDQDFD